VIHAWAICVCVPWCKMALYKYSSFPFLFPLYAPLNFYLTLKRHNRQAQNLHPEWSSVAVGIIWVRVIIKLIIIIIIIARHINNVVIATTTRANLPQQQHNANLRIICPASVCSWMTANLSAVFRGSVVSTGRPGLASALRESRAVVAGRCHRNMSPHI